MRLTAFIAGIAVAAIALLFSPHFLKDNPAAASYWIPKVFTYQDRLLAERDGRPKLVVISGSNGIYGYDGEYLETYSNFDVVNMAVHIGFDIRLYKNRLAGKLERGDVVIAPLEHAIYRRPQTTDFHQKQNLLWLHRFFDYDSVLERFRYYLETPSEIFFDLGWQKLQGEPRPLEGLPEIGDNDIKTPRVLPKMKPLHVSLADRHGFFNIPLPPDESVKKVFAGNKRPYSLLPESAAAGTPVIEALLELKASVEAQGASFYLTWPAMADIPSHSRDDGRLLEEYRNFQKRLAESGLAHICEASRMILPPRYFTDTVYHVNSWGALDRSIKLAQCLRKIDRDRFQFAAIVDNHTVDNQLAIRNRRDRVLAPFELVRREVAKVESALEAYYRDHGEYPVLQQQWP